MMFGSLSILIVSLLQGGGPPKSCFGISLSADLLTTESPDSRDKGLHSGKLGLVQRMFEHIKG